MNGNRTERVRAPAKVLVSTHVSQRKEVTQWH